MESTRHDKHGKVNKDLVTTKNDSPLQVNTSWGKSKDLITTKNAFPFQVTPSGNLKVKPKQVVFETDKFSVLVADPCTTNVSVQGFMSTEDQKIVEFCSSKPTQIESGGRGEPVCQRQHLKNYLQKTPPQSKNNEKYEMTLREMGFVPIESVNWDSIKLPTKTSLMDMLHGRIIQRMNTDLIVKIGSKEFKCHKLVLQSYSQYFACKDLDKKIELPENKVSSKAFHLIYSWMTELPSNCQQLLQRNNILDVFSAAQFLQIKELENQCLAFVDSEDLFCEDTAFLLYWDARKKKNVSVMELMVPRIQRFFLTLVSSKDWLDLSLEEIVVFLHSNYICVHSEMEIFMAGIRWLMADFAERKSFLIQVMECVRFGNMSPVQLVEIRRNRNSPEIVKVTEDLAVQKMIEDGLSYAVFKDQNHNDPEAYKNLIASLRLEEPEPRNWAGLERNYKSYKDFMEVLDTFKTAGIGDLESDVASEDGYYNKCYQHTNYK